MTHHRHVAALYDIHGNLPALEAVLGDVQREGADVVLVGGDVFPGPMCVEALTLLSSLAIPVMYIMGNGDRETLAARGGNTSPLIPAAFQHALRWCASEVTDELAAVISSWPATIRLEVDDVGGVLFCHATPDSDVTIITRRTPAREVAAHFVTTAEPVVVCGHTHMQFDRRVGSHRIINAGSVGMPFGAPGAYWLWIGPDITLRHTSYDLAAAAARVRKTRYPQAAQFAKASVLHPPGEDEMLAHFTPKS